jgi:hypothetical protein
MKGLSGAARRRLSTSSSPMFAEERVVDVLLKLGLAIVTAMTFASAALLAVAHVSDRYEVNQASGTWFALAWDLREGLLYRPLLDDGYYGLSAYMPLQFVVNAGASLVTGEYLVSAKLVAYITGLALLILVFTLLRRAGCPSLLSLGLVAALVATHTGLVAVTGIHGDTLPLLLQLIALSLILRSTSRQAVGGAAALCALAAMAKFTAIWAPLTIALWLVFKARGRLGLFLATFVGSAAATLVLFEIASAGRMSENLAEVFVPGGSASEGSLSAGISTFFELMVERAGAIWLLLPFAVLAVLQSIGRRSLTLGELALVTAVAIVIVILGNPGSDFNHLVDVGVLAILVVGEQWAQAARLPGRRSPLLALMCVAVILGTVESYRVSMKSEVVYAANVLAGREPNAYTTTPLDGVVRARDSMLSEDPVLPILRNERPLLLDGIGLRRLGERRPVLLQPLERRLDRQAFDKVVLINPLADRHWYEEISMGPRIRAAIARNYALFARVSAPPHEYYWVYAPKGSAIADVP